MTNPEPRLAIPGALLSVAPAGVWSVQPVAREAVHEGLGSHLLHVPSGIALNVRVLPVSGGALSASNLEVTFARYADLSWPGARSVSFWTDGSRRGVTGVFEGAMPEAIVREWMVTDGERLANASTFASKQRWDEIADDCETLVRSIRFGPIDGTHPEAG
jgi:hypothetical protein